MKKDMDELLKQALTPTDEPNFWLNQRILNQIKETDRMDRKNVRKVPVAAIAAAIALGAGSVSAYAAWKYLEPKDVVENLQDKKLMDAFQGKDAVVVNERQSFGGYNVTFLGIVSGKDISEHERTHNGTVCEDRTYTVVAIEKADGTPMDDAYGELSFFASPLIKGYDPNWYNAVTMRGDYSEFIEDGILYRLATCDNVEIFADRGLYLCVSDSMFYNNEAYVYDKATGEIKRNEAYEGLNALFGLPIDTSKADPAAVAEYRTVVEEEENDPKDGPEDGTNGTGSGTEEDLLRELTENEAEEAAVDAWMERKDGQ